MFGHDILYVLYEVLRLNKHNCLELNHISDSRIFLSEAWALPVQWVSVLPIINCLLAC